MFSRQFCSCVLPSVTLMSGLDIPPVADLGRASFSNVYVLALGHADLPGENLIEGILNQTVQHVCLPMSDSWLVNAHPSDKDNAYRDAFTGWLFLKVARRGTLNLLVTTCKWR